MNMTKPLFSSLTIAVLAGLLTACGGSGDNTNLDTLGDQVTDEQKDHYYVPNDFYDRIKYDSETLQFQLNDSYLQFTYSDDYTGTKLQNTVLADGLPGDTLYTRVLVTGLATDVEADVWIESDGDFAEFAIDKATGLFGETSYEDDMSKLSFGKDKTKLTNGTWVWVKIPVTEYDQTRQATLYVGNTQNPLTNTDLVEGIKTATIIATTPTEQAKGLEFTFADRTGLNAAIAGEEQITSISVTNLDIVDEAIDDFTTKQSHEITGITATNVPIAVSSPDGAGQYRIKRRGSETFEQWTSEPGVVSAFDRVEMKVTASQTKLAIVKATLTIGEGDNAVSDEWVVETLGDINASGGVLYPPKSAFTNAVKVPARGRVVLRDSAEPDTTITSLVLKRTIVSDDEPVEEIIDIFDSYNPVNGIWQKELSLAAEAKSQYVLEAVTSLNETVSAKFTVTQSATIPTDFPNNENKLVKAMDLSVDLANNRYIVLESDFGKARLIAVDMDTSERTELIDLHGIWGKSNTESVQVDNRNNRVFTGDRPSDDIYQVNLGDTSIHSIFSSHNGTVVGSGSAIADPAEMDIDYANNRLVSSNNNGGNQRGVNVINLETGERWQYVKGQVQSVAVDHDLNRYLMLTGNKGQILKAVDIVPSSDELGTVPLQTDAQLGDNFTDARSIAVVSYKEYETSEAIEAWTADGFKQSNGDPVAEEDQVGFALVGENADDTLYKVNLKDGSREVFSNNGTPNFDVPFSNLEAVVVEYTLGFALVSDVDSDAIFAVDLKTGQRMIITK
ncbi:hypothetical protein C2869_03475 [Saccharobesus litoralis]|uniref:Uncharacterized protein n=1 Tax=Saccharobesus litoralis TaxID=2172099 RepID=A0A2S0VMZ6_9ALTE|nr:hypothetical protein [Saccharobesus litoralis]AWB65552.1 hypothetical protein C2869_03475 [Saccharobesus litoralis]